MSELLTILHGDALDKLRELPDESVHCCVTSPPYWGLRDYGTAAWEGGDAACDHKSGRFERGGLSSKQASNNGSSGDEARHECKCGAKRIDSQLGLEKTPEEYVAKMVEIFREVRRVLRRDGTLWLNLGDSYASSPAGNKEWKHGAIFDGRDMSGHHSARASHPGDGGSYRENKPSMDWKASGLKPKDLCGIPWRVAFALQADGWWLRSDIIWAKPNPMPESVTDRPTKAHEYIFLLTKSANYFYDGDAIKEKSICPEGPWGGRNPRDGIDVNGGGQASVENFGHGLTSRNKRSVWTIATQPYPEAHFATFPEELPKLCILAGTSAKGCCAKCGAPWERIVERGELQGPGYEGYRLPKAQASKDDPMVKGRSEGWWPNHKFENKTLGWKPTCGCYEWPVPELSTIPCTVLDPFAGSGTTGAVSLELGRKAVLIELNPKYAKLIDQRCDVTPGLQLC